MKMPTVTIDDTEYDIDSLSDDAKAQLESLQATDGKILQAQRDIAIFQTARNAYAAALRELINNVAEGD